MKFTDKQIKRILNVQEFISITNILSKIYIDFENKEYVIDTLTDRNQIYKIYCASIYNLIKAIQDSKEYFACTKKYNEFEEIINQEYLADDNKYYSKDNYKASLFKIIETVRHQVNHSLKDDEDNNILFESYIDFEILEYLRNVIIDIYNEVYNKINKSKIKDIILSKPKVKYSFDRLSNKFDELKSKIPKDTNKLDVIFKKDNDRALELINQLFNSSNLYDLYSKNPDAIKKLDLADKEIQDSFKKVEDYLNENGTDLQKNAFSLLKNFTAETTNESIRSINKNMEALKEKFLKLVETQDKE